MTALVLPAPAEASSVAFCAGTQNWTFSTPLTLTNQFFSGSITNGIGTCGAVNALSGCAPGQIACAGLAPFGIGYTASGNCVLATGTTSNGWSFIIEGGTTYQMFVVSGLVHGVIVGTLTSTTLNPCSMSAAIGTGVGYAVIP